MQLWNCVANNTKHCSASVQKLVSVDVFLNNFKATVNLTVPGQ